MSDLQWDKEVSQRYIGYACWSAEADYGWPASYPTFLRLPYLIESLTQDELFAEYYGINILMNEFQPEKI